MGFISRKLLPACENACICFPALKPSSRRPVKRYKKLLADIFPKKLDSTPNERKITKLCEYAAKNHVRIPKIAKFLEQKCYKELQEQFNFVKIIMEVFSKLLYVCKEQMAYFAGNLLNVILVLLDAKQEDSLMILGCQTLTRFVYSQADSTYLHSIETIVPKVGMLALEDGGDHNNLLRAASLQCLSAMIWFMTKYSFIFADFKAIIHATLENYVVDDQSGNDDERHEQHHNWVDEVIGCEARAGPMIHNIDGPSTIISQPSPETKDSSIFTREERESPKVWSQICIQKLAELAKETTTMRKILDPMFSYFDKGGHWAPHQGLALNVLSELSYFSKNAGSEQFILVALIRHVDHKYIMHDPQLKSNIVQIAAYLVKQLRSRSVVAEIGFMSDLCRHLRISLQADAEIVGTEEGIWNTSLQTSIEDCLLEIAKGIGDVSPLFDMMTITLEKLPSNLLVARATIGSLLIIADVISLTSGRSNLQLIFPETLLLQLLKAMLHPDVEARLGAHLIFWVIIAQTPIHPKHESEGLHKSMKRRSRTTSAFASATALLEKLQREREYGNAEKHINVMHDEISIKEMCEDEGKHGWLHRSSPYFHKLSCSVVDRAANSTYYMEAEINFITLNEDQIAQLLSGFWRQAHQPDNSPSNYEAIANSFCLTLFSSHLKNPNHGRMTCFFQLPLSLMNASLDPTGALPPTSQRSLFTLSLGMLAFTGKIFHILEFTDSVKLLISCHVDPYLKVGDDFHLYTTAESDMSEYGSEVDQEASISSITELRKKMAECGHCLIDSIVQHFSRSTSMNENDVARQLSEAFTPEDGPFYGTEQFLGWDVFRSLANSEESLSLDEEHSRSSSVDGSKVCASPSTYLPQFTPTILASSVPQFASVGQLLESALHVAGQVAGTTLPTSPLPYDTITSNCEAFGMDMRKKLSSWLVSCHDDSFAVDPLQVPYVGRNSANAELMQIPNYASLQEEQVVTEQWRALRLPPASPFDNFMRAAGC